MGQVKDIYWHPMQGGDEFTGRCGCLPNMMSDDFALSPAFFDDTVEDEWLKSTVGKVFPEYLLIQGFDQILQMSLASLIHYQDIVMLAFDPNHPARNIPIFQDLGKILTVVDKVKIVRAWESSLHAIIGVPPHIKGLMELVALQKDYATLTNKVYEKVMNDLKDYFEVQKIGGREMTEARVREMIADGCRKNAEDLVGQIQTKLNSLATVFEKSTGGERLKFQRSAQPKQQQDMYVLRTNSLVQITRLPNDFQFPNGNAYDCWVQWNVGTVVRQTPPLQLVQVREFQAVLDTKPKTDAEKQGQ
jgi:hypothetical protein